ncbi:MAG: glycosyltransferase family 4 protein [bacterium]
MGQKRPRIAYIIADAQLCGGVAVVCQHANRLACRGFDTCIVSTAGADRIDWFPGQSVPVYPLARIPSGIDVGVATWWETTHDLYRLDIPRKFYFIQSDETRFYDEGRYERIFARDSYRFDFECMTEARWIQKWLKDNFGKDAHYVPNGIDLEMFYKTEPLEPKGDKPRVLIEGPADMPSKGVAEAFQAVRGLDCEVWHVNYRGEPDPSWKPDRYFFAVPMAEMRRVYSSCDILLKLSTVEGSSGPPLEMMACGGTCVLGRVTGMDEAIVDGENALIVEQGDIEGARKAVKRLLDDRALRARLIARGMESVRNLAWEKSIDVLEKIFLSAAGPSHADRSPSKNLLREKETAFIDAYRCIKTVDKEREALKGRIACLDDGIASLKKEIDLKKHELNAVYHSKQWKIAEAIKEARRSLPALLALPFRILRIGIGSGPR